MAFKKISVYNIYKMLGLWRKSQRAMSPPKPRKARSVSPPKRKKRGAKTTNNAANLENLINMSMNELAKRNRRNGLRRLRLKNERALAARRAAPRETFAPKVKKASKKRRCFFMTYKLSKNFMSRNT